MALDVIQGLEGRNIFSKIQEQQSSPTSSLESALTSNNFLTTSSSWMSSKGPKTAATTIFSQRLIPHDFFSMSSSSSYIPDKSSSLAFTSPYESIFSSFTSKIGSPSPPSSPSSFSSVSSPSGLAVNFLEKSLVIVQDNFTSLLSSTSSSSPTGTSSFNSLLASSSLVTNETSSLLFDELRPYKNFLDGSRFWIQRVLVPLLMVIGAIGNTITIIIMTRRRMRSSTNNYLAALATFDMLYLVFIFVLSLSHYPHIHDSSFIHDLYWQMKPFSLMITDCCSNCSVWLTVTFTIERYIVVSHPIKGKVICTESRARKVILCVFLICFAYTLPTPFEWIVIQEFDQSQNMTMMKLDLSDLGKNSTYRTVYSWLFSALFVFVPLLLLGIFNSFLIRSVHVSRKARTHMTQSKGHTSNTPAEGGEGKRETSPSLTQQTNGQQKDPQQQQQEQPRSNIRSVMTTSGVTSRLEPSSSKQETKITVMLIAVVILFFFCQLPTAVMLIFSSIHDFPEDSKEYLLIRGLNNIFNFLVAINAAGNFLLYCFFSQRYRKTFVAIFCPCYRNKLGYFQSTHPNTAVYSKTSRAATARETTTKNHHREGEEGTEMTSFKNLHNPSSDQRMIKSNSRSPSVKTPLVTRSTEETTALTHDEDDKSKDLGLRQITETNRGLFGRDHR